MRGHTEPKLDDRVLEYHVVPVPPPQLVRNLDTRVHQDTRAAFPLGGVEPVQVVAEEEAFRMVARVEL